MTTLFEKPVEIIAPVEVPEPTVSLEDLPPLVSYFDPAPFYQVEGIKPLKNGSRVMGRWTRRPLDSEMLSDILYWAFLDHTGRDMAGRYEDWGSWNQGQWANRLQTDTNDYGPLGYPVTPEEYKGVECTSAFCIAGQVVAQRGMILIANDRHSGTAHSCAPAMRDEDGKIVYEDGRPKIDYAKTQSIPTFARDELGLTENEETMLFSGGNNIGDVVTIGAWIARRRGVALTLPEDVLAYDRRAADANIAHWDMFTQWVCPPVRRGYGSHCSPQVVRGTLTQEVLA